MYIISLSLSIYIYIYIYLYTHAMRSKYRCPPTRLLEVAAAGGAPPKIHFSVEISKGLSLVQWIFTGSCQCIFSGIFQWNFVFVISGV